MAGIQKAARPAPDTSGVAEILASPEWSDVKVIDYRKFWLVAGAFHSTRYSQTGKDPVAMARALDTLARAAAVPPPQSPEPEALPEPPPAPEAIVAAEDDTSEGEPLPDPLARLVPETIEQAKRKEWLRERHQELNHKIHGANVFGAPSAADVAEHEQLERYRGFFA